MVAGKGDKRSKVSRVKVGREEVNPKVLKAHARKQLADEQQVKSNRPGGASEGVGGSAGSTGIRACVYVEPKKPTPTKDEVAVMEREERLRREEGLRQEQQQLEQKLAASKTPVASWCNTGERSKVEPSKEPTKRAKGGVGAQEEEDGGGTGEGASGTDSTVEAMLIARADNRLREQALALHQMGVAMGKKFPPKFENAKRYFEESLRCQEKRLEGGVGTGEQILTELEETKLAVEDVQRISSEGTDLTSTLTKAVRLIRDVVEALQLMKGATKATRELQHA
jgi:hypothetical protein